MNPLFACDQKWFRLDAVIHMWAHERGTKEVELWSDTLQAFANGVSDGGDVLVFEKETGRLLSPRQVADFARYAYCLKDRIYVTKGLMQNLALSCKRSAPSCCYSTEGSSEPSRAPEESDAAPTSVHLDPHRSETQSRELPVAPMALVREKLRLVCQSAKASGGYASNLNKLPREVQRLVQEDGYHASLNFIQEIAREDEFKSYRRPRGRTLASEQRKKAQASEPPTKIDLPPDLADNDSQNLES